MSVLDQAHALFGAGREREAVALVEDAAGKGDGEALWAIANWRLFALHGPRDLKAAHRALRDAAAQGHAEALRTRAFLTANGTGVEANAMKARQLLQKLAPRDPYAALQLNFLPRMKGAAAVRAAPRERLSDDPSIELVRGLMLAEECRYLVALAEPELRPSFVVDPASGKRIPHPVRTSWGTSFGPTQEDLVVNALNRRLASATGTRYECGEPLHMLRYQPGQEYRPHVDALPGVANQRAWTAILYLNEEYQGGETVFPDLGLTARGRIGDVLIFRNVLADGRGDPRTRHAGLPVTQGAKWIATRWIRQRPYHPWEE